MNERFIISIYSAGALLSAFGEQGTNTCQHSKYWDHRYM